MGRTAHTAWLALPLLAVGVALALPDAAHGQVEPHYWRQRTFFIPYQPTVSDRDAGKIDKVQLLVSRDGLQQWAVLQEAEPHVRGFSYHAAADGEYAFAVRMSDRGGKVWPEQIAAPLLRIVVDTQAPTLQLAAALDATGQVMLRYEGKDIRLKPQSLRLEAQLDGGEWQRVVAGPPDVNQPDRLLGQASWTPPRTAGAVKFRMMMEDAAGNPGTAEAQASMVSALVDPGAGPQLAPPSLEGPAFAPQAGAPADGPRSPLEWPANNSFASEAHRAPESGSGDTRFHNTFASDATSAAGSGSQQPGAQFGDGVAAPSLLPSVAAPTLAGPAPALPTNALPPSDGGWTRSDPITPPETNYSAPPAVGQPGAATPWVNSLTFDLDYDIQTVGPWGVAKVELWGTKDGGRQWQSLGVDQDNRSPMRVTVPAEGVYGFRIAVAGGNGVAAPTPQPGEQPEMMVGIDMAPPRTELRAAELGQGLQAGQVVIRWTAADENLAPRPVGLFYSASTEGPWTTIATDLDNGGEYAWRLGRDAPPQVFLRIEVRDQAGNVAVQQSPAAVDLNLPRPTGRLRNVRPVQGQADPNRYRTASGVRPAEG